MRNPFRRKPLPTWRYTIMDLKTREIIWFTDTNNHPPQAEARILEHLASLGHKYCEVIATDHDGTCKCGDHYAPCGNHVEVDPANPCLDCARIQRG